MGPTPNANCSYKGWKRKGCVTLDAEWVAVSHEPRGTWRCSETGRGRGTHPWSLRGSRALATPSFLTSGLQDGERLPFSQPALGKGHGAGSTLGSTQAWCWRKRGAHSLPQAQGRGSRAEAQGPIPQQPLLLLMLPSGQSHTGAGQERAPDALWGQACWDR